MGQFVAALSAVVLLSGCVRAGFDDPTRDSDVTSDRDLSSGADGPRSDALVVDGPDVDGPGVDGRALRHLLKS
jgi:hypothetical protein